MNQELNQSAPETPAAFDRDEFVRGVAPTIRRAGIVEIRVLGAVTTGYRRPHTESGYFDNADAAADAVEAIGDFDGVYSTFNQLNPALIARSPNKLRVAGNGDPTTSDHDVTRLLEFFIDIDAPRPADTSASDEEIEAAFSVARKIVEHLKSIGWTEPATKQKSGNGGHIGCAIDLPPEDAPLLAHCLEALDQGFSTDKAHVDLTAFNPARIRKLAGTLAKKGAHLTTPETHSAKTTWPKGGKR